MAFLLKGQQAVLTRSRNGIAMTTFEPHAFEQARPDFLPAPSPSAFHHALAC